MSPELLPPIDPHHSTVHLDYCWVKANWQLAFSFCDSVKLWLHNYSGGV